MQGTCIDPNFPYCDTDGSIGGTPGACIAVTCTVGQFSKCDGNNAALTCNMYGTGYDQIQCAHGCDESIGGCRLCEPNQTVCANGMVASCDANGNQTQPIVCPLGCFEDQPRCRDIDPSNRLGLYYDMVATPPDVDLTGSWNLNASTGILTGPGGVTLTPPTFEVPSLAGGPETRLFVVNKLTIGDLMIFDDYSQALYRSVSFLASGDVTVTGTVTIASSAGSIHSSSCRGASGTDGAEQFGPCTFLSPGGGGAATSGAHGGTVIDSNPPVYKAGGIANGTDDLQPLVGGCSGGGASNSNSGVTTAEGGWGGGAIQISSRTSITVTGAIHADGDDGFSDRDQGCRESWLGAGGGGAILLEAPKVALSANAMVSAIGGTGWGCTPGTATCGAKGKGGTGTAAASPGGDAVFSTALGQDAEYYSGGGGGGVGRVRINTQSGSYTLDATAKINAVVTASTLKTR